MDVATYALYCVGCHSHVLIRADASQKEWGSDAQASARTSHSRA